MENCVTISRLEVFSLRAVVENGPRSSLADMPSRNGLLLRVEDEDGAFGWGEIWCNFPPKGNEARHHLLEDLIGPQLVGERIDDYRTVRRDLWRRWGRMANHVGEIGPFGHCFAGIDTALWDLHARRSRLPLSHFLASNPAPSVKVYASSPNPSDADSIAASLRADGYEAIKLKVGINPEIDIGLVESVREAFGDGQIMIDANQNWSLNEAIDATKALAEYDLTFVEEPISAQAPLDDWSTLAQQSPIRLAAGENICTEHAYDSHLEIGALGFYQPDVAKWGGVSGCLAVGKEAAAKGATYCPHFMGTAVGLAASIHLLAAVGGDGFVELDANENPLRTALSDLDLSVENGRVRVPDGVGIGIEPDAEELRRYQIM